MAIEDWEIYSPSTLLRPRLPSLRALLPAFQPLTTRIHSIHDEMLVTTMHSLAQSLTILEVNDVNSSSSSSTSSGNQVQIINPVISALVMNQITRQAYSLYHRCLGLFYTLLYVQREIPHVMNILDKDVCHVFTTLLVWSDDDCQ